MPIRPVSRSHNQVHEHHISFKTPSHAIPFLAIKLLTPTTPSCCPRVAIVLPSSRKHLKNFSSTVAGFVAAFDRERNRNFLLSLGTIFSKIDALLSP